jgi:hypothetical protein
MGNSFASQEDNGNLEHSEDLRDFEKRNEMLTAFLADAKKIEGLKLHYSGPIN